VACSKKLYIAVLLAFLQAISVLHEVVRLEPNLPDSYHTLGLVYGAIGDHENEMGFYMIYAHLTPKDSSLWKWLFVRSM
jgi:general transcription factor 3C polypeptide 3 (transcription factor C subunit 4)